MATNSQISETSIRVLLPKELKNELVKIAQSRNQTVSSMVRLVMTEYIKKNSFKE